MFCDTKPVWIVKQNARKHHTHNLRNEINETNTVKFWMKYIERDKQYGRQKPSF